MDKNIISLSNLIPVIGEHHSYEKTQENLINLGQMQYDVDCAYDIVCKMFNDQETEAKCTNISDAFESKLRQNGFNVESMKVEGDEDSPWDTKWVTVKWPNQDNVPQVLAGGARLPTRDADLEFMKGGEIKERFKYTK